jgi:galactokinase
MISDALRAWSEHFDGRPDIVCRAPGRVNLIGEHTDYNEGFVFPAALDLQVVIAVREAKQDRLISPQIREAADRRTDGWRRYVYACRSALEERGLSARPIEALVVSSIPSGSGLSSSAAIELAFLTAWNHLEGHCMNARDLAEIGWRAENHFVGVRCGRMDQLASAMGVRGCALFIDTRDLSISPVQIPEGLDIVILDTGKPRSLAAGKYNERVHECRLAVEAICLNRPLRTLRDATLEDIRSLPPILKKRARHVITENLRVPAFRAALEARDLPALGKLSQESHESLKLDYEVSSPELDAMARSARAAPGCVAARLTGAGFGGCCVALIHSESSSTFRKSARASYEMYNFPTAHIFATKASDGAGTVAETDWNIRMV